MDHNPNTNQSQRHSSNEMRFEINRLELKEMVRGELKELQTEALYRRINDCLFVLIVIALLLTVRFIIWLLENPYF